MNIPIIYEDNWLLVVDKPTGLLTIPTPRKEERTLTNILNEEARSQGLFYRIHPCHRLDRETSGLIIYAKGRSIQKKIMEEFRQKRVKKIYVAFVQGLISHSHGKINKPIEGLKAQTQYRVIQRKKEFTVVEIFPLTGRTNQIRIHFKGIGHPLVGERKFAFRKDYRLRAKRLCLHARVIEFVHPQTKRVTIVNSKLPQDMEEFLKIHN